MGTKPGLKCLNIPITVKSLLSFYVHFFFFNQKPRKEKKETCSSQDDQLQPILSCSE